MKFASKIKKPVIFAIGNAPTALIKLYEMIQEKTFEPAFIIGVPVGFVNVEAAKELQTAERQFWGRRWVMISVLSV